LSAPDGIAFMEWSPGRKLRLDHRGTAAKAAFEDFQQILPGTSFAGAGTTEKSSWLQQ